MVGSQRFGSTRGQTAVSVVVSRSQNCPRSHEIGAILVE